MARLTATQKKILKSLKPAQKRTDAYMKRALTMADRYRFGTVSAKGKKSMAKKAKKAKSAKRARKTYARRKTALKRGHHRPVVIWTGKKFRRPKKSKIFTRATRINPKRSRRRYRRNPLSLPKLPFGMTKTLSMALPVAGGIALGMFAMPQIVKFIPASMQKHSKFFGIIHIALGVGAMTFVKKDVVKTLGGTLVAMGLYDLIAANIPQLNLPTLPRGAAQVGYDEVVGSSFEAVGTDFTPATMGASYGASYGEGVGDDIDYGGDSIEIG